METKTCTKCNLTQSIECFSNDKSKKDGKRPSCKICKSMTDAIYRKANIQ